MILKICLIISCVLNVIQSDILKVPPSPKFENNFNRYYNKSKVSKKISNWNSEEKNYLWELSGLFEGDIMIPKRSRNSLTIADTIWPNGIVPYYIKEIDFTQKELKIIKNGIKIYNEKTCILFRPYLKIDKNWIV